jgi:hypothetical protein
MNPFSDKLVIDIAKDLISTMQDSVPGWKKAYIRFEASDEHCAAKGSYVTPEGVSIFNVLTFKPLFSRIQERGVELRSALQNNGKHFCLFLLTVDAEFQYNIDFEWNDPERWKISKMNGASGLPEGVKNA